MRLLQRLSNGEIVLIRNLQDDAIPRYAILSHTWGNENEEVTFDDMVHGLGRGKAGYDKINFCGEQAAHDGLQYFWVDSCCIDKGTYAVLQEAISSMFRWYKHSTKCYVYLSDVSDMETQVTCEQSFRQSRWFTRGWTLQELLAPTSVEFFSKEGRWLGSRHSFEQQIYEITGIPKAALQGGHLSRFSVNERMSWIQPRQTKLEEDLAYSLLGIFGVDMPLRYDEGKVTAFKRRQKEIEKSERCVRDLRLIDPHDHKQHIEHKKGGLLESPYRWILEHSHFQTWRDDRHSRLLWVKSDPGKGKAMLLCGIINELNDSIGTMANSRTNNATSVLRGLIYTLVLRQPLLISHVWKKYDYAGKALFEDPNAWFALSDIFTDILHDHNSKSAYLIVDALDECLVADLPKLVDFIAKNLSLSSHIKWLVSSRNWPLVEERLEKAGSNMRLSASMVFSDSTKGYHKIKTKNHAKHPLQTNKKGVKRTTISIYIQHKVLQLTQDKKYDDIMRDTITEHLTVNADNTFLWVSLVCQSLETITMERLYEPEHISTWT